MGRFTGNIGGPSSNHHSVLDFHQSVSSCQVSIWLQVPGANQSPEDLFMPRRLSILTTWFRCWQYQGSRHPHLSKWVIFWWLDDHICLWKDPSDTPSLLVENTERASSLIIAIRLWQLIAQKEVMRTRWSPQKGGWGPSTGPSSNKLNVACPASSASSSVSSSASAESVAKDLYSYGHFVDASQKFILFVNFNNFMQFH